MSTSCFIFQFPVTTQTIMTVSTKAHSAGTAHFCPFLQACWKFHSANWVSLGVITVYSCTGAMYEHVAKMASKRSTFNSNLIEILHSTHVCTVHYWNTVYKHIAMHAAKIQSSFAITISCVTLQMIVISKLSLYRDSHFSHIQYILRIGHLWKYRYRENYTLPCIPPKYCT